MIRTQIQLQEDQMNALKKIAAEKQISLAELIRKAVDTVIKSGAVPDYEERRKRAIDIAGKFSSGNTDIALRHDEYLAKTYKK